MLPIIQDGLLRNGLQCASYDPPVPADCRYTLRYTARQGWDFVNYLKYAELELTHDGTAIGLATYRHGGGFGFTKWASSRSKLDPVIDQMLGR